MSPNTFYLFQRSSFVDLKKQVISRTFMSKNETPNSLKGKI